MNSTSSVFSSYSVSVKMRIIIWRMCCNTLSRSNMLATYWKLSNILATSINNRSSHDMLLQSASFKPPRCFTSIPIYVYPPFANFFILLERVTSSLTSYLLPGLPWKWLLRSTWMLFKIGVNKPIMSVKNKFKPSLDISVVYIPCMYYFACLRDVCSQKFFNIP